jgi:hypothetical protein
MKMFKHLVVLALSVFLFLSSAPPQEKDVVGKISFKLNNVLLLAKGAEQFKQVTFQMPLKNGDRIETKKESRCELTFSDGSVVRIDEMSIYTVEKAEIQESKKEVESTLSVGKLWANVKRLVGTKDSWKLKSPAAVVAVRGTIYRMNAGADSSTQVLVYDGSVAVSPAAPAGQPQMGTVPGGPPRQVQGPSQVAGPQLVSMETWFEIVKAQQQIIIRPDGTYAKSEFNLQEDGKLDWVMWNKERDKAM